MEDRTVDSASRDVLLGPSLQKVWIKRNAICGGRL
jgi:hypothetical protein